MGQGLPWVSTQKVVRTIGMSTLRGAGVSSSLGKAACRRLGIESGTDNWKVSSLGTLIAVVTALKSGWTTGRC